MLLCSSCAERCLLGAAPVVDEHGALRQLDGSEVGAGGAQGLERGRTGRAALAQGSLRAGRITDHGFVLLTDRLGIACLGVVLTGFCRCWIGWFALQVSLHGGQVVSWRNDRGEDLLFTSSKVTFFSLSPSFPLLSFFPCPVICNTWKFLIVIWVHIVRLWEYSFIRLTSCGQAGECSLIILLEV